MRKMPFLYEYEIAAQLNIWETYINTDIQIQSAILFTLISYASHKEDLTFSN